MFLFDFTDDRIFSDGHTSLSENVNIRIELKFDSQISNPISRVYDGLQPEETSQINEHGSGVIELIP